MAARETTRTRRDAVKKERGRLPLQIQCGSVAANPFLRAAEAGVLCAARSARRPRTDKATLAAPQTFFEVASL